MHALAVCLCVSFFCFEGCRERHFHVCFESRICCHCCNPRVVVRLSCLRALLVLALGCSAAKGSVLNTHFPLQCCGFSLIDRYLDKQFLRPWPDVYKFDPLRSGSQSKPSGARIPEQYHHQVLGGEAGCWGNCMPKVQERPSCKCIPTYTQLYCVHTAL